MRANLSRKWGEYRFSSLQNGIQGGRNPIALSSHLFHRPASHYLTSINKSWDDWYNELVESKELCHVRRAFYRRRFQLNRVSQFSKIMEAVGAEDENFGSDGMPFANPGAF